MDKALIEQENVELLELFDVVSKEAVTEKYAVPSINEILYWWTRKPLVVGRAVVLTSTLRNIQTVRDLLSINDDRRSFRHAPNMDTYKRNLGRNPIEINVLDPFAGAGNLIFEAKRLGLNCTALDYNPVAYLIMKAVLEYPAKYGVKLAEDVERLGKEVIERTKKELGIFFRRNGNKAVVYLWMWCIKCPHCGQRVPLTNHSWIVRTKKTRIGVRFRPTRNLDFRVEMVRNMKEEATRSFTQKGGKAICIKCRNSIKYTEMTNDITNRADREMIAVVVQGAKGKEYEAPSELDKKNFVSATHYLQELWKEYDADGLIPNEDVRASHRRESRLWHYGINEWRKYFSSRQLLVMLTLLRNIRTICKEIDDKGYAKVVATYLAFLLCKHLNSNTLGVIWNIGRETVEHTLIAREPRIMYNHTEINPFERGRGSLHNALKNITNAIVFAAGNGNPIGLSLGSALHLDVLDGKKFDLIVTDPPYLDDVAYGELSELFYVWLSRVLSEYYPELPTRVPIDEDITMSWGRFGDKNTAFQFYERAITEAFKQMYMVLKDDGLLTVFFAHSGTNAWNLLLNALRESKFRVESSYSIHTESEGNIIARGKTSFMSSIVVACRKITSNKEAYFEDLLPKIEDKIKELFKEISTDKLLALPITDMLIMTYGKVLEEATQYTVLKSYNADFKPDFEILIKDAREYIMKQIVTKLTGRSPNLLGTETSFYLIGKIFFRGSIDPDEGLKLARTYGLDIKKVEAMDIAKKDKEGDIQLLYFNEIDLDLKPEEIDASNLHKQLLYLEYVADKRGANAVKNILTNNMNFRVEDLKQIVLLLIKHYMLLQNKGKKLTPKEDEEYGVLKSVADVLGTGSNISHNTMDKFM